MKYHILNKCLGFSLLFLSCSKSLYPMWFFGSNKINKEEWIKRSKTVSIQLASIDEQQPQKTTADSLDKLIQDDNYPEALSHFNTFLNQHDDQSKYALRWAWDAADRGIFPIQYTLIKYYERCLQEGCAGLSFQEVERLCMLIIKGDFLIRMAVASLTEKGYNQQVLPVWRYISKDYYQFLNILIKKYQPDYEKLYNAVGEWIADQHEELKKTTPFWLIAGNLAGQLSFELPDEAIKTSLKTSYGAGGLEKQNEDFLVTHNENTGHINRGSWENFSKYLQAVAQKMS